MGLELRPGDEVEEDRLNLDGGDNDDEAHQGQR